VNSVQGEISVGVKAGDWIEYTVVTSGNPPEQFNLTWARMQILNVESSVVYINVTTKEANGTFSSRPMTLDLERGAIGAWFIIPANLNVGDSFLDSEGQYVEIQGEQRLTWAGDVRTLTNATTSQRIKQWDRLTGVFVECIDVFSDYSINATAIKTNIWGSQESADFSVPKLEWLVIAISAGVVVLGVGFVGWKIKTNRVIVKQQR
jgi:hypothetical protein